MCNRGLTSTLLCIEAALLYLHLCAVCTVCSVHLCTCLSASHDPGSDLAAVVHLPACPTCVNLPSNLVLLDDIMSPKRKYLSSLNMVSDRFTVHVRQPGDPSQAFACDGRAADCVRQAGDPGSDCCTATCPNQVNLAPHQTASGDL